MLDTMLGTRSTTRVLAKDRLEGFLSVLSEFGQVWAPRKVGRGSYAFEEYRQGIDIALDYVRTIIPPKNFFFPAQETLYSFSGRGYVPPAGDASPTRVIFGLHPCDIKALEILDVIFNGKYLDPRYFRRRNESLIVGLDCSPDEYCFCDAFGNETVEKGFDLFLTDLGSDFFVRIGTPAGEEIVRQAKGLFAAAGNEDVERYKERSAGRLRKFRGAVQVAGLAHILELEYDSPIWIELGERCLSCGNCSMVCPTCYCYDVKDILELDSREIRGARVRRWDSCLLPQFATVAGGHNFRGSAPARLKWRLYHKQVAFVEEHGRPGCVGCGRCIVACPAEINVIEVIQRLRGERIEENAG